MKKEVEGSINRLPISFAFFAPSAFKGEIERRGRKGFSQRAQKTELSCTSDYQKEKEQFAVWNLALKVAGVKQ